MAADHYGRRSQRRHGATSRHVSCSTATGTSANRPPIESSDIEVTATSMHAIQLFHPGAQHADYEKAIRAAAAWLTTAHAVTTEDGSSPWSHRAGIEKATRARLARSSQGSGRMADGRPCRWATCEATPRDRPGARSAARRRRACRDRSAHARHQVPCTHNSPISWWYVATRAMRCRPTSRATFARARSVISARPARPDGADSGGRAVGSRSRPSHAGRHHKAFGIYGDTVQAVSGTERGRRRIPAGPTMHLRASAQRLRLNRASGTPARPPRSS